MTATIFGSFSNPAEAERAAGALLDHGLHDRDLSLLVHQRDLEETAESRRQHNEIEAHETGNPRSSYAYVDSPTPFVHGPAEGMTIPGGVQPHETLMAGGLEPDAASRYQEPPTEFDPYTGQFPNPTEGTGSKSDLERTTLTAETGITTTTGGDAAAGAAKGAAVGLGVGVLAALASVFVPGVGLVIGSGVLATAIAGTAGATGAGLIAGGAIGYMKDQGVPEDALTTYRDTYGQGGAILAVNLPPDKDRAEIEAILAKYGAMNVDLYGDYDA